jgi:hypothetical protein
MSVIEIPGPGKYAVNVVGVSQYQDALERVCGGRSEESAERIVKADLVPEDANPHDENAVRVDIAGSTAGYLSRDNARHFRKNLSEAGVAGMTVRCSAKIVGGWDKGPRDRGHFGVRLDLPTSKP